ncbi:hypothetical protein [Arvimicrobium flavum]|uniref:hypothetical protein n=1 Tax=Arvimicrobium flavum TaxID=3393320 RepID=UPI00237B46A8|nr:hypothetical protein [Mesorhizobium shangrilense]
MTATGSIEAITTALRDEAGIRALFLSGSRGYALDDAYSDIDFLAVAVDGPTDRFSALWRDAVGRTGEIVLWWDRQVKPMLINAITDAWVRVDVLIVKPDQVAGHARDGLRVLFDRDGIFDRLPASLGPAVPNPPRLKWQIEEFVRIVGLLPLAMGRQEYLNSVTGAFYLRNLLIDLFIEETGAPNRGGALHLNRLITEEQKELLRALPPFLPTRDAMLAAYLEHAAIYLPRARRLATKLGVEWPERFEAATRAHLGRELAIELPASRL